MKTLNEMNNIKVEKINVVADTPQQREAQVRNIIRQSHFFELTKEINLDVLEFHVESVNRSQDDKLDLHIFGTNGEHFLSPCPISLGQSTFISTPFNRHDVRKKIDSPFVVSGVGFTCDKSEMTISCRVIQIEPAF